MNEQWFVGSHRSVDHMVDGHPIAVCEIYSGGADSLKQADAFQCLIAAAPDMLNALNAVARIFNELPDSECGIQAGELTRAALAKATCGIHEARTLR